MNVNISQLDFPKASSHTIKALDIVSASEPDLSELERVIMQDPILAGTVIRYANSPLYRTTRSVTNVQVAIQMLGIKSIRSAIVTASIRSILPDENQVGKNILSHLLDISVICRLIAHKCCSHAIYDLEFLGLFHNIGMLILAANYQKQYEIVMGQALETQEAIDVLELQHFGLSHGIVSEHAAREFRLPTNICTSLKIFHSQDSILQDKYACVLVFAHHIWNELNSDIKVFNESSIKNIEKIVEILELSEAQISAVLEKTRELLMHT